MDFRRLGTFLRGIGTIMAVTLAVATVCFQARAADAPAAAGETPSQGGETPGATKKTVDSAERAKCQSVAAAFGKRTANSALLGSPEARVLGMQNPQLVMCTAVLTDSDEPCKRYLPVEHGPSNGCLQLRAIFHELRTYPGKPTYMFTDLDWQLCRNNPDFTEACDKLRAALRSGNEKECAGIGIGEPLCRAAFSGDKAKCDLKVVVAKSEVARPDPKQGEPKTLNVAEMIAGDCHEKLETRAWLKDGLKQLAESAPPQERALARAALGQADACSELVDQAVARCAPGDKEPAGESTPAATPRPAPQEP